MFLDTRYWQGSADKNKQTNKKTRKGKSQQNNKELSFSRAVCCPAMKPRVPVRLSSQPRLTRADLQQPSWMFDTHLHSSALSDNGVPFSCFITQKLGIGRSRRERSGDYGGFDNSCRTSLSLRTLTFPAAVCRCTCIYCHDDEKGHVIRSVGGAGTKLLKTLGRKCCTCKSAVTTCLSVRKRSCDDMVRYSKETVNHFLLCAA